MKRLLVLRHAKAERDSATGRDFDRPLTDRGWDDAREVGRVMNERGLRPDAILASPAKRVVETLAALADGYGPLEAGYEGRIYNASPEALRNVVREANDNAQTLLLIGHNPGLQLLLLDVTRGQIGEDFPTSALAVVDLAILSWAAIDQARGELADLILR